MSLEAKVLTSWCVVGVLCLVLLGNSLLVSVVLVLGLLAAGNLLGRYL